MPLKKRHRAEIEQQLDHVITIEPGQTVGAAQFHYDGSPVTVIVLHGSWTDYLGGQLAKRLMPDVVPARWEGSD